MTIKEKYEKLNHKEAITDKIAFKINGTKTGRYLRTTIMKDKIDPDIEKYVNEVFDKQLKFQEIEKKHYEALI